MDVQADLRLTVMQSSPNETRRPRKPEHEDSPSCPEQDAQDA